MRAGIQFWDASALISLIFEEVHSPIAFRAVESARVYLAWDWLELEATSALKRRNATPAQIHLLSMRLGRFQLLRANSDDFPKILKTIEKHGLRAADAGHLFYLMQAKSFEPDLEFVCFDNELVRAAKGERIRVFGHRS